MTMTFAVWQPDEPLRFADMSFTELETLVGSKHTATARTSLWRDGNDARLVKLLSSDVALLFPDDYARHGEAATRFVASLGGPVQPWAGVLAVYGTDSVEGGWPESLTAAQRAAITAAYEAATDG